MHFTVKILGVMFSRKFSVTQHVKSILAASAQALFALRTLRHHGMPASAIQTVFQAIVVAKPSYASPAYKFINLSQPAWLIEIDLNPRCTSQFLAIVIQPMKLCRIFVTELTINYWTIFY